MESLLKGKDTACIDRRRAEAGAVRVVKMLLRLGAEKHGGLPTKNAWQLYLLPKIPVMILVWPSEEKFPSRVKILFDSTTDRFLDAESLILLAEGMVRNIEFSY